MLVGVISDTHSAGSGTDLPQAILSRFEGVDLILHCGDLECLGVLDVLEQVAPVLAVRGYEDPLEPGDRLANVTRVVKIESVLVGMVHDIQWPIRGITTNSDGTALIFESDGVPAVVAKKFGQRVDVVLFGDTHEELVCEEQGIMFVNPGSPTYPGSKHLPGTLGTLAILEIKGAIVRPHIVQLGELVTESSALP